MDDTFNLQRLITLSEEHLDKCICDMFFRPDYRENFNVVDQINNDNNLAVVYMQGIASRLVNHNSDIILSLVVNLLKVLVQNCISFIPVYGQKEYQEKVLQVVKTTKFIRARFELLNLVQLLGTYYSSERKYYYYWAYDSLRTYGFITFAAPDQPFIPPNEVLNNSAPNRGNRIHKNKSSSLVQDNISSQTPTKDGDLPSKFCAADHNREQIKKGLNSSTCDAEQSEGQVKALMAFLTLAAEMIDNMDQSESNGDNEILSNLIQTIQNFQKTTITALETRNQLDLNDDDIQFLELNDKIQTTLNDYQRKKEEIQKTFDSNKTLAPTTNQSNILGSYTQLSHSSDYPAPINENEEDSEDEFSKIASRAKPTPTNL